MLSGNLADFALLGVMQMLLSSNRTGCLHLEHARGGDIWIENGEVVHATALGKTGDEAISLISSLADGRFVFEQNVTTPERTIRLRREMLLGRMMQEGDAWAELLRAFPDWSRPLRFTGGWSDQTRVTRRQYLALSGIGKGHLAAIVSDSDLPPRELLELLLPFWQAGKIEYAA
ncbi:DUF4388 domain-containing protein [Deinococcus peraridilitoris]|uniref:PatA-like N-terminal domain-containing protein n=1 Tax=Deinococcus peraridilitoris (strain DSM 19664 / LMG 22246 / CIP 109416 / KR-200) TaxID=937777 RepID=K9ZWS3_DEIPD|nr:DUF4388 domain-containing protein [Deinococcus peraridilitoris]AFZ66031.1 hypothetical protein Deipe_0434 [Deinococcus peraridilitoris DSM 19664]